MKLMMITKTKRKEKHQKERNIKEDSAVAVLMGVETVQNLKIGRNVGQIPNADRKKNANW